MRTSSEHFELSFLITFCRQKEYAHKLIDSLLVQETAFPFEILVGIDGEDDGIVDILDGYIEKYPFIKYYRLNSDSRYLSLSRASHNRLFLLSKSRANYFCVVDGDDFFIDKDRVEKALSFLHVHDEFVGHACSMSIYNHQKDTFTHKKTRQTNIDFGSSVFGEYIHVSQCIFRNIFKKSVVYFNKDFFNDRTLFRFMAKHGMIYLSNDSGFAYRVGQESIYASENESNKFIMHIAANIVNCELGYSGFFKMRAAQDLLKLLSPERFSQVDKKLLQNVSFQKIPVLEKYERCFSSSKVLSFLWMNWLKVWCKFYIWRYDRKK